MTKVAILGAPTEIGRSSAMLHALQHEQAVRATEMKKRREQIGALLEPHLSYEILAEYENLSRKELKKKSKEFCFIHMQIKDLGLSRYAKTHKGISNTNVAKISTIMSYISHSKQFCDMDMEKCDQDYFDLVLSIYAALKGIGEVMTKFNISLAVKQKYVFISSEIGLRLYSLYIDHRMDM